MKKDYGEEYPVEKTSWLERILWVIILALLSWLALNSWR